MIITFCHFEANYKISLTDLAAEPRILEDRPGTFLRSPAATLVAMLSSL